MDAFTACGRRRTRRFGAVGACQCQALGAELGSPSTFGVTAIGGFRTKAVVVLDPTKLPDRWITDWPTSQRFPHYTRANAGEVLADPVSPLGWTFAWDGGIVAGYKAGLIRCGAYEDSDFDATHPETVACFGGYFYINLSAIRMQGARNPAASVPALDAAFFGNHPDVPTYVPHPEDSKPHLVPAIEAHMAWVLSRPDWPRGTPARTAWRWRSEMRRFRCKSQPSVARAAR